MANSNSIGSFSSSILPILKCTKMRQMIRVIKNRVKNDRNNFHNLTLFFFHTNKFRAEKFQKFALLISMFKMFKIHSMKIPNHIFMLYLHNFQFFYSGFPHLEDKKRAALLVKVISNFLLSSFTLISISYPAKVTMF